MRAFVKQDVKEKLMRVARESGSEAVLAKIEKELGKDFNPEDYDRHMEKAFGDQYYEDEEADRKEVKNIAKEIEEELQDEDAEMQQEEEQMEELPQNAKSGDIWMCCDGCHKVIKPGKYYFECQTCDNFCFCKSCYGQNETHAHVFKKEKVPSSFKPPKNAKDLVSKAYIVCVSCGEDLGSKAKYVCKECEIYICKSC